MDPLEDLLTQSEGRKAYAYRDSRGYWTIGIGCLVDSRVPGAAGLCAAAIAAQCSHDGTSPVGAHACVYQDGNNHLRIASGCLVDPAVPGSGICDAAIEAQFQRDKSYWLVFAQAHLPNFGAANVYRQAALASMCFQLGTMSLWTDFKGFLERGDWAGAAADAAKTPWATTETPARARRELAMLASGLWVPA